MRSGATNHDKPNIKNNMNKNWALPLFIMIFFLGLIGTIIYVNIHSNDLKDQMPLAREKRPIELFLDSCFAACPNAHNNDVARSVLADTIQTRLNRRIASGDTLLLKDFTGFEYHFRIKQDVEDRLGQYFPIFRSETITIEQDSLPATNIYIKLMSIMDKAKFAQISTSAKYKVESGRLEGLVEGNSVKVDLDYRGDLEIDLGTIWLTEPKFTPL